MQYNLLSLYDDLESNGVDVYNWNVKGTSACTLASEECTSIFIDYNQIKTEAEETCILAHEYGHFATGTTHQLCSPLELVSRHEYKANKIAIKRLLPIQKILFALQKGIKETWELADYFNLTEDFVCMALDYYGLK